MSEQPADPQQEKDSPSLLHRVESHILGAAIVALVLLAAWQIIRRALFNEAWIHADGLIRQSVLWLAVLGALAATGRRKHIAIELDPKADQRPWAAWKSRLVSLISAAFCATLAWYGWRLVELERDGGMELLPGLPMWCSLLILPIGFGLMALRFGWQSIVAAKAETP
ncbi:TRAP transporter small permease [Pseudomarimonas arenosa]|uniref:TRAP transporter small permease protein n=1 Tax=Pseudomarimonas arenosa TaxID=2774145 RepID=A0AAW3ZGQ4_9GAMM|nr:TRAP transporter small permease [Pseudomarimonas arenosa]MBD8525303.1 TRAP transporter small permease [Pseudomarimonas arenosa]